MRSDAGRTRYRVNGVGRNAIAIVPPDELQAMSNEVVSVRRTDGLTRKQRRAEYVLRRKEEQQ